jgi:hypothetical protein
MKNKHNKKRNTAFVFESLIREMSRAIISKDRNKKQVILEIFRDHFSKGSVLEKELDCYRAIMSEQELDNYTAEKMIHRVKAEYDKLGQRQIFEAQSKMIKSINKSLSSSMFSNFVPNYKDFATIAQIFSDKTPVGKKVILEKKIIEKMTSPKKAKEESMKSVDSLVVKNFINKFNESYGGLLPEQKNLLSKYVQSFGDNEVDFRLAVGNELKRLHESVKNSMNLPDIASDEEMINSTNKVLQKIENLNVSNIDEKDLKSILKLQSLVKEYEDDATED